MARAGSVQGVPDETTTPTSLPGRESKSRAYEAALLNEARPEVWNAAHDLHRIRSVVTVTTTIGEHSGVIYGVNGFGVDVRQAHGSVVTPWRMVLAIREGGDHE
jgi:hypothetical protein